MLISIILPVYNSQKYIAKCLDSFVCQKSSEIELIIVDDGSTDKSNEICLLYKKRDERIRIIKQENAGVSSARNKGIKNAKGKYIYFLDSDDLLSDDFSEVILETIKNEYDMYFFDYAILNLEGKTLHGRKDIELELHSDKALDYIFLTNSNNEVWCNLYKREIIISNGTMFNSEMKMGEDLLFNLSYAKNIHSAVYISIPIYIYNSINDQSAMHVTKIEYLHDYILIYKYIMENYQECCSGYRLLDLETYLNAVFRTILHSKYNKNNNVLGEFKNSELYNDLVNHKYNRIVPNLKKRFFKFELYRSELFMRIIKATIYK